MDMYPDGRGKEDGLTPTYNEALRPHIDQTHDEILTWTMDGEGERARQLCIVRSCGIREGGVVTLAELLTFQPVDLRGDQLEDKVFELFLFPNLHGGVYTARAFEFEALQSDKDWQTQTVQQRLVRFGIDLKQKGAEKGVVTVESPTLRCPDDGVRLDRGGRLIGALQIPLEDGAIEELAGQDAVATRGIEDFLQKYHRLAQLPGGGSPKL